MMDTMRKCRGAISIFLVIVLLPMLTVASVFVDMSRLNLAKSMAASAGDLTLNTALTNYDAELKNLYGLFATSQNMDELMSNLEDYYRESIVAAGVSEAEADDYVGQIMSYLKSTTGTDDLMNIELSGFEVSVPTGANLGNPAVLKSQIVEFMKYRAPLSLGTGFLDALSMLKNLSKQTKLVEDKNAFYKEYQGLLEDLEDAWWQIELYQYSDASKDDPTCFPTGSYLTDHAATLDSYQSVWKDIISNTVKYLYNYSYFEKVHSQIYVEYACPECGTVNGTNATTCSKQNCDTTLDKSDQYKVWSVKWNDSTSKLSKIYTEDEPATTDDVLRELNTVYRAIASVKKYQTGEYKEIYQLVTEKTLTESPDVCKIYAVCKLNEALTQSGNYLTAVKNLLGNLVQLQSALETCNAEELAEIKVTLVETEDYLMVELGGSESLKALAQTQITAHYNTDDQGYIDMFNQVLSRANEFYDDSKATFDSAAETVNAKVDMIRDEAYSYDKMLEKKIGNLTEAIRILGNIKTALTDPASEYSKTLEEWKKSADALGDDSLGKDSKAEIEELIKIVTADNVQALITRLTNAKTTLESIRTQIANYKFAGTSWKDIADGAKYITVIGMLSQWDSEIDKVAPTSEDSYNDAINTIYGSVTKGTITNTWAGKETSPNLTEQQRELYTWMCNNFYKEEDKDYSKTTELNGTTSGDEDLTNAENDISKNNQDHDAEVTAKTEVDVSKELTEMLKPDLDALPSTRWDEVLEEIEQVKGVSGTDGDTLLASKENDSLLEQILNLASNLGTEMRDNLYVTEYIMSMFSYDTIEAELYVEKNGEYSKTDAGGNTIYKYEPFYEDPDGDGTFTVKDNYKELAAEMTTLTNNVISPEMNFIYGGEVEYILYGQNGEAGVYGTIFAIRFALNTVYAFMDAEIANMTLSAATALFGVPPLTPLIPLAQAAMIIALAVAETTWDLVKLRQGEAIPLMKNSQTWVMKPSGIASEVKDGLIEIAEDAVKKVVDEGYKILNDVLAMTADELQDLIDDTEDGLSDLVTATTQTVTSQLHNYANEALQKVVELCNAENQKAMLDSTKKFTMGATPEKVKAVCDALEAWLAEQSQDDKVIYEVKKAAVDYLIANDGALVEEIFNTIKAQTDDGANQDVLHNVIDRIMGEITTKVNNLIGTAGTALNDMVTSLEKELEEAAKEGAEKLKETLSNKIGEAFGSIPTAEGGTTNSATTNAVSSLLSWTYSDYLRIFVVIGLFANEEAMILRLADVIEMNMRNKNNESAIITTTTTQTVTKSRFFGLYKKTVTEEVTESTRNDAAFTLEKAYTYMQVHATLQVKPLLMTLPFMADTVENELAGYNWYEIDYTGTLGY